MRSDDSVSVVIPTHNRAHTLMRALDSVAAQDWQGDLEIVVTDNASTDSTESDVAAWLADHPEVALTYSRSPTNLGPVPNWQRGIEIAQGNWLKIVWSDDALAPEAVRVSLSLAHAHDATTVTSGALIHLPGGDIHAYRDHDGLYGPQDVVRGVLGIGWSLPVSPGAALVRRHAALEGVSASRGLGLCRSRAIGPDLALLYHGLFTGGVAYHTTRLLAEFWGGEDSITMGGRRRDLRFCYLAALNVLIAEGDIEPDAESQRLLRHQAVEARVLRHPSAGHLPRPRFSASLAARRFRSKLRSRFRPR